VHGHDGLGDTNPQTPKISKIQKSATDFLIEKTREFPNEIIILALGPLTNIAEVSPS
jgi:uridine nucleosidase